jgi:hypothetical protein
LVDKGKVEAKRTVKDAEDGHVLQWFDNDLAEPVVNQICYGSPDLVASNIGGVNAT